MKRFVNPGIALALLILVVGSCSMSLESRIRRECLHGQAEGPNGLAIGEPGDRPDRLIEIRGPRSVQLLAEFSTDKGKTWAAATICPGAEREGWNFEPIEAWNVSVRGGVIPSGDRICVWNHAFDFGLPSGKIALRLRMPGGPVLIKKKFDSAALGRDVFRIDHRTVARLAGRSWRSPWTLAPASLKSESGASITCVSDVPDAPALNLNLRLQGWYRIYAGIDDGTAFRYAFSGRKTICDVPVQYLLHGSKSGSRDLPEQELPSENLTGRRLRLMMSGSQRTFLRYIRFVRMTTVEVRTHLEARRFAAERGRPFAGYLEPYSVGYYIPYLGLREHLRNEMRLNVERGSTDVYVHVIRIGAKAWYHSDVVEREMFRNAEEIRRAAADVARRFGVPLPPEKKLEALIAGNLNWTPWMHEGDPLAVAVAEGRALGLKVFADAGMNVTHIVDQPFLTEATVRDHPEFLSSNKMFMDYRRSGVRDYAVSVCRELLLKYDLDGLNMDFARWGYKDAYGVPALNDVVRRVHEARGVAERKWGHRVLLAARIPSYLYNTDKAWGEAVYGGEHPWFLDALRDWAREGWIDRVMVCSMSVKKIPELSLVRYRDALAGSKVALWGDLYGFHDRPSAALLELGRKWIAEGLDGGFFIYDASRPTAYEDLQWRLRILGLKP